MRKIKFRGFSLVAKKWVYGYLWIVPGVNLYYILTGKINIQDCSIEKYEVYPKSIGQYTGIKDKDCKEIYEGDRVHYENMLTSVEEPLDGVVVFNEGSWLINNKEESRSVGLWGAYNYLRINGNIYENL